MGLAPRETERRLRNAAIRMAKELEVVDEVLNDPSAVMQLPIWAAMWLQEARIAMHTAVAKLTGAAEVYVEVVTTKVDEVRGAGLYVPDHVAHDEPGGMRGH